MVYVYFADTYDEDSGIQSDAGSGNSGTKSSSPKVMTNSQFVSPGGSYGNFMVQDT